MKTNYLLSKYGLLICALIIAYQSYYSQSWEQKGNYPDAQGGDGSVSFSVGNKMYVGGGFITKRFYEYDVDNDTWIQKADLPGVTDSRCYSTAFVVNGKGYICLGFNLNPVTYEGYGKKDLWEYDPAADIWTQKADYPGVAGDAHFSFVINNTAYVGGGEEFLGDSQKDFYAYDPVTNSWTKKADFPDPKGVVSPFAFVAGNKGYVSCGMRTAGPGADETRNTYMYDPLGDTWSQKKLFAGSARQGGVSFVLNNRIFCGWGYTYSTVSCYSDFFEYDPSTDVWLAAFSDSAAGRAFASSVAHNGKVYLGLGWNGQVTLPDWHEITMIPPNLVGARALSGSHGIAAFPNPFTDRITLKGMPESARYFLYSPDGRMVLSGLGHDLYADGLPEGIYILEVRSNGSTGRLIVVRQ